MLLPNSLIVAYVQDKVYLALQVLVTACPCALVLSTPVVIVAGLTAAAKSGIIIKGGHVLESMAAVKALTFDKTGTLTQGRFQVLHHRMYCKNHLLSCPALPVKAPHCPEHPCY